MGREKYKEFSNKRSVFKKMKDDRKTNMQDRQEN